MLPRVNGAIDFARPGSRFCGEKRQDGYRGRHRRHGAVLCTASAAAMRGMKVIVPVDGVSAHTPFIEQYVAWHLADVPVMSPAFTLTTIDQVTF
jgi:hypothetical protein